MLIITIFGSQAILAELYQNNCEIQHSARFYEGHMGGKEPTLILGSNANKNYLELCSSFIFRLFGAIVIKGVRDNNPVRISKTKS